MSGTRLELANPGNYGSVTEYIEQHVAPVAQELHRITEELMSPGSSSVESWEVDMVPAQHGCAQWLRFDRRLQPSSKSVFFNGARFFDIPKETLKAKQVKVAFTATVYAFSEEKLDIVEFRLVDVDGKPISNSQFSTDSVADVVISRTLPFGDAPGSIQPKPMLYFIEGRSHSKHVTPVCRRMSLSFLYV